MKRFHVHVAVKDLDQSIRFYATVFGAPPSLRKDDYAKWMLDEPRVNFAISSRGDAPGINHLGIQVDSDAELHAMREQVGKAELAALDEPGANCCYARSDKYWVTDPQGVAWETFHTLEAIPVFGASRVAPADAACCAPAAESTAKAAGSKACCG